MSKREDIFEKLDNLIEQNQFELVSDKVDDNKLKVIYLMNDAVESFIVFENARITGEYIKDYQGEINTSLTVQKNDSTGNDEYVLVVHQKDSVCTVFFEDVSFEVNLYNYGRTAHFWIEGYEYLRQLEYKISILRDKLDYLGEKYCRKSWLILQIFHRLIIAFILRCLRSILCQGTIRGSQQTRQSLLCLRWQESSRTKCFIRFLFYISSLRTESLQKL